MNEAVGQVGSGGGSVGTARARTIALEAASPRLSARFAVPGDGGEREAELREVAEQFVATHLLMPLMNELREQPLDSEWLDGGLTEDAFGKQLDTILADRIVKRADLPIVDAVYRSLSRHGGAAGGGRIDTHG